MLKHERCCICGKEICGWGNNPEPIKQDGECCDECNAKYVVPARIGEMHKQRAKENIESYRRIYGKGKS